MRLRLRSWCRGRRVDGGGRRPIGKPGSPDEIIGFQMAAAHEQTHLGVAERAVLLAVAGDVPLDVCGHSLICQGSPARPRPGAAKRLPGRRRHARAAGGFPCRPVVEERPKRIGISRSAELQARSAHSTSRLAASTSSGFARAGASRSRSRRSSRTAPFCSRLSPRAGSFEVEAATLHGKREFGLSNDDLEHACADKRRSS